MLQNVVSSVRGNKWVKRYMVYAMVMAMFVLSIVPASAQSLDLDIDLSPLFDSINQFFPIMLGVLIIPAGIMAALYLARYIVSLVVKAFAGGSMG